MVTDHTCPKAGFEPVSFRRAMGKFATGVAVVTTAIGGARYGMTVNSLTSVSLEPCLLLVCPRAGSATGTAIHARGAFVVNILSRDQHEVTRRFAGRDGARFEGLATATTEEGLPVLAGCLATIRCTVFSIYGGGDHDIVLGAPIACEERDGEPLLFHGGRFGTFAAPARTLEGSAR